MCRLGGRGERDNYGAPGSIEWEMEVTPLSTLCYFERRWLDWRFGIRGIYTIGTMIPFETILQYVYYYVTFEFHLYKWGIVPSILCADATPPGQDLPSLLPSDPNSLWG